MSQTLTLAADFIERMSNPGYGIRVNEDYSLRLGSLLASEGFDKLLRHEIEQLKDPETLSPHGWLWLLSWARSRNISLNDKLLLNLTETLSNVFMQIATIDLATRKSDWKRRQTKTSLKELDHPWLSELLFRCTKVHDEKEVDYEYVDTRRSETVLIALMQIGSDVTLEAAGLLLNHRWRGQSQLVNYFWSLCAELDHETQEMWISRLRPPKRQPDDISKD